MSTREPARRVDLIWLLVLLIVALVTRLPGLALRELWLDEANSVLIALKGPSALVEALRIDGNPPFYYLVLHVWVRVFGIGETAVRMLSVVLGTALLPLVYETGRRWFGRVAAVAAGLYVALSPLHVFYSGEARMYTLVPLVALLALVALDRFLEKIDWRHGGLYAVLLALCLYTHNYALFFVPVGLLYALGRTADRRRGLLATGVSTATALLLAAPWFPVVLRQARTAVGDWIPELYFREIGRLGVEASDPALLQIPAAVVRSLGTMAPGSAYPGYLEWLPTQSALAPVTLAVLLVLLVAAWFGAGRGRVRLCALFLFVPMLVPIVFSALVKPIYLVGRYEMIAFPACALLVGAGAQALGELSGRRGRFVLVVLGLVLVAASAISIRPKFVRSADHFCFGRAVGRHLEGRVHAGDALVFLGYTRAIAEHGLRKSVDLDGVGLHSFPRDAGLHPGWYDAERYRGQIGDLNREALRLANDLHRGLAVGASVCIFDDGSSPELHRVLLSEIDERFGTYDRELSNPAIHLRCHRKR